MSFLDPKTRIFDTILTQEGKNQLASGKLKSVFYSFTDSAAFYDITDTFASGSKDFAARPILEASNLPQDRIVQEIDDSGKLLVRELKFLNGSSVCVLNGQFFSGSFGGTKTQITDSTEFFNATNTVLSSSVDNFKNLYLLAPFLEEERTFDLSPKQITYTITDERPIPSTEAKSANVDMVESLFADKRLSHIPNYQFLPPVNKPRQGTTETTSLGSFVQINQRPIFEFSDLTPELESLHRQGFKQDVLFTETSKTNRIVGQIFECAGSQMTKLDVIDFGTFSVNNNAFTEEDKQRAEDRGMTAATKHVFFVGKLFRDSNNSDTFVNLFTLVWS